MRGSLEWIRGWRDRVGTALGMTGVGSGWRGVSLLLGLRVDVRFSALNGRTVTPAGSFLVHPTNTLMPDPHGAGCWGEAVDEMWAPGPLRSFEQRAVLSEAPVRIPSDLPSSPASCESGLSFLVDGWAGGGRAG